MNEKLKELAVKAKVEHCISHVRLQDFAELIIKECASVVEQQGVDPAFKHMLSWAIKKRFGIEE